MSPEHSQRPRVRTLRWPLIGLVAALVLSTALVLLLALEVRQSREAQRWLAERASQPYQGMYVPRVPVTALDGSRHELGQPRGEYQVLYFFTTTCPHCRASVPLIKSIADQLDDASGGQARMLGIAHDTPEAAAAYAREHELPFPIVASQDRRTAMLFRARKVPLVMVVGRDGRVRYSRIGVLNSKEGVTGVLTAVRGTELPAATTQ
ncbi:MAG: peroxiredoxin family protein [Lysobacter sp.]